MVVFGVVVSVAGAVVAMPALEAGQWLCLAMSQLALFMSGIICGREMCIRLVKNAMGHAARAINAATVAQRAILKDLKARIEEERLK